jgi:hypothetical protein
MFRDLPPQIRQAATLANRAQLEIFEPASWVSALENCSHRKIPRLLSSKHLTRRIFSAFRSCHSPQVNLPALLRPVMRNARKQIAETATRVRPVIRLADWSCMSVTQGANFQLETGLIRKARV